MKYAIENDRILVDLYVILKIPKSLNCTNNSLLIKFSLHTNNFLFHNKINMHAIIFERNLSSNPYFHSFDNFHPELGNDEINVV